MAINPNRKLELSPEARTALKLPLTAQGLYLADAYGSQIGTVVACGAFSISAELAAFIAALLNEALTPAGEPEKAAA